MYVASSAPRRLCWLQLWFIVALPYTPHMLKSFRGGLEWPVTWCLKVPLLCKTDDTLLLALPQMPVLSHFQHFLLPWYI